MDFEKLALYFGPQILNAIKSRPAFNNYVKGAGELPDELVGLLTNQYDVDLMNNNLADIGAWSWDDGGVPHWQQELGHEVLDDAIHHDYNLNLTPNDPNGLPPQGFPSDYGHVLFDDLFDNYEPRRFTGVLPFKALNPILPKQELSEIWNGTKGNSSNWYDMSPALGTAAHMLMVNPRIGTPNDPAMLPYQDPMEGLDEILAMENSYERAPRHIFEDTAIDPYSLTEDDNPDDELGKMAKRLIKIRR